jgi:LysM repeat protein
VSPEKLMTLNPTIRRWATVRIGQKIVVPTAPTAAPTMTVPPVPVPSYQSSPGSSPPETTEITVAPGDSLNRLATRYNSTPDRIRELNPQITNWKSILPGQKLVVPTVPNGRD